MGAYFEGQGGRRRGELCLPVANLNQSAGLQRRVQGLTAVVVEAPADARKRIQLPLFLMEENLFYFVVYAFFRCLMLPAADYQ